MTTNGVSTSRSTAVISIVRTGDGAHVGSLRSSVVDPDAVDDLVAAADKAAHTAPEARDAAALPTGAGEPADWDDPLPGTGAGAFAELARGLSGGFGRSERLYGFAHHTVETTFVASSTGVRRRFTQPTGSVEINAKRGAASAWAGISTPWFADVPIEQMLADLSMRLDWSKRTVELPAGRYETLMPPSTVADMMIYLGWSMDGRGAQEGRTALSAPGGGTDDVLRPVGGRPGVRPVRAHPVKLGAAVGVRQRHGHRSGGLDPRRRHLSAGLPAGRGRRVRGCARSAGG
jgi:predicted Zn-dependent protease